MTPTAQLDATFTALSDPTRREIITRLASGDLTVTELARPLAISIPAVAKHVRVLQKAGLVTRAQRAQSKPCQLTATPLKNAVTWLEQYRQHWEETLDNLGKYLQAMETDETEPSEE